MSADSVVPQVTVENNRCLITRQLTLFYRLLPHLCRIRAKACPQSGIEQCRPMAVIRTLENIFSVLISKASTVFHSRLMAKSIGPRRSRRGPLTSPRLLQVSGHLPAQESGDIKMIIALWCLGHRCRTAVDVQTLRRLPRSVFRYRSAACHLLGDRALRLALRQRRHGRHRWTRGGPAGNRRLAFLVAAAKADIGQTLQQRQLGLLRMIVFQFA